MDTCELIVDGAYRCGECPMWDKDKELFLWSDMLAGNLYTFDPTTKNVKAIAQGKNVGGFTVMRNGNLLCAAHQGIYSWNEFAGWKLIENEVDGQFLHCNDAAADPEGRFIFGTTFYNQYSNEHFERGRLYSIDTNGQISILEEGLGLSNGIAFSPDKKIMYVTDTYTREILAYDYDRASGKIKNRKTLIKVPDTEGIPDGLTVDSEGCLWSAQWYGYCVKRYDPEGKVISQLNLPTGQVSSVMFGGNDLTDIYVTTAAEVVRLNIAPAGYDFNKSHHGAVYKFSSKIQGIPEDKADIKNS